MSEVSTVTSKKSELAHGSFEDISGSHEKINAEHATLEAIEAAISHDHPDYAPAHVTGVLDAFLIDQGNSILHHPEAEDYKSKMNEAASQIAVEGADEYNGKVSDGDNPITIWEFEGHGDSLHDVVASYQEAGAIDDATMLAQAIDGLANTEAKMAGLEAHEAHEKLLPNTLKDAFGKVALSLAGLKPVIGPFGTLVTETTARHQDLFQAGLVDTHGYGSDTYKRFAADKKAFKVWKEIGAVPSKLPYDQHHKDSWFTNNPFIMSAEASYNAYRPTSEQAYNIESSQGIIEHVPDFMTKSYEEYPEGLDPDILPASAFEEGSDGKIPPFSLGGEDDSEAIMSTWKKAEPMPYNYLPEESKAKVLQSQQYSKAYEQMRAEETYEISIGPAKAAEKLSAEDIVRRFEVDHVVKTAPELAEQARDESRTNEIITIAGKTTALHAGTSSPLYENDRKAFTEHEVLQNLEGYLQIAASAEEAVGSFPARMAQEMLDKMTYIGKQEYDEATAGIADYWKACLEANPALQILAVVGKIDPSMVKSDQYLLDNILANFDDAELEKYTGRLITTKEEVSVSKPEDLKMVMLDDWTISGSQLRDARASFLREHPGFESSIEVQLIAANKNRVTRGLAYSSYLNSDDSTVPSPIRAYFVAHHSEYATMSSAHITGSHSSVDFDAENEWANICLQANIHSDRIHEGQKVLQTMPSAANIVRPYRMEGVKLEHKERLERYNKKGRILV